MTRLLLALWLTLWVTQVCAADHIVGRAYLEDPSATLTLSQVQTSEQHWTPFEPVLNKGYTPSVIWLRLTIDPGVVQPGAPVSRLAADDKLILRIRPTVLDQIELFDPLEPSGKPRLTGDRTAAELDEYSSLSFNFVIPKGDAPRTLWLRLKTSSSSLLYVKALSLPELHKSDRRTEIIFSIILALQALFMAWGLVHWSTHPDRVVSAFVLKQALGVGFAMVPMGYLRFLMSDALAPDAIDKLGNLLIVLYTAAVVWFDYQLLRDYQPPLWGIRLMQLALLLLPLELGLVLAGQAQAALSLNIKVVFFQPLLSLLLVSLSGPTHLIGDQAPVVSKRVMTTVFAVFAAAFATVALAVSGLIPTGENSMYIIFIHALLTGVVMLVLLQVKAWRTEARQAQTQADLALAQQRALQAQQQRLEQSQFLDMLAHELKTPLSVVRLVLGSPTPAPDLLAHARQSVQDMDHVIERCLHAGQLDDGQLKVQNTAVNLREEYEQLQQSCASPTRLHLTMPSDLVVHTDAKLLRIVLSNLIDNALKYSPTDSAVDILIAADTNQSSSRAVFSIQNLPGTAAWPDATRVFQKYYRSRHAHHQTGSGLGLYLVHSMASLLGGELRYTPDEKFVRFTLWLPL